MNQQVTKTIHPFPARMAPSIVWDEVADLSTPHSILDPMAGSGTTVAAAKANGQIAVGCDTDPLAILISRALVNNIDAEAAGRTANRVHSAAVKALELDGEKFPDHCDSETKKFIEFWFDRENQNHLTAISNEIKKIRNAGVRNVLWAAFSRLIVTKEKGVSLAKDVSHSRPHRAYQKAPKQAIDEFLPSVRKILKNAPFGKDHPSPKAKIYQCDARRLRFSQESFDKVITSPPYLNAIDYLRGHKLALVWIDSTTKRIRELRSSNIGAEIKHQSKIFTNSLVDALNESGDVDSLEPRQKGMLMRYVADLNKVCSEVARVLRKGGDFVCVIGDSSVKGTFVSNSNIITKLCEQQGLVILDRTTREIPDNRRYLPAPSNQGAGTSLSKRMRTEVVLKFRKPKS